MQHSLWFAAQCLPEHKSLKDQKRATDQLKTELIKRDTPPSKDMGCTRKGCTNPVCLAAEAIQDHFPFLDWEGAREIIVGEHRLESLISQVEVQRTIPVVHGTLGYCHRQYI